MNAHNVQKTQTDKAWYLERSLGWSLGYALCFAFSLAAAATPSDADTKATQTPPTLESTQTAPPSTATATPINAEQKAAPETALPGAATNVAPSAPSAQAESSAETTTAPTQATTVEPTSMDKGSSPEAKAPIIPMPCEECASLRAMLAKVEGERDEALQHLEGVRSDVEAIRRDQIAAQTRATGLEADFLAARTRIAILEKNLQMGREQSNRDATTITGLTAKAHDALEAAGHCGESLVTSEARNQAATDQVAHLQQDVQILTQAREELTGQVNARDASLAEVHGQLQDRDTALATARKQIADQEATLTAQQRQIQEREAALSTLKNQLSASESQSTGLQSNLDTVIKDRDEARTQVAALETEKTGLQENLVGVIKDRDEARTRVAALDTEKTGLQEDLVGVTKDRDEARTQVAVLETEKTGLQGKLSEADTRYRSFAATLAPVDGGTLDAKTAQTKAVEIYDRYAHLWEEHLRHTHDTTLMPRIRQIRQELFIAQYRVMRTVGAAELYMVRPHDSLSDMARMASGEWNLEEAYLERIRNANAHIVKKNAALLVGTPLIVP